MDSILNMFQTNTFSYSSRFVLVRLKMLVEFDRPIFHTIVLSISQHCSRLREGLISSFTAALLKPSLLTFHQPQRSLSIRMAADGMCQIAEPDVIAIPVPTAQPEPCAQGQACEVEPPTEEGDDWRCQLDLSTARFHGGHFGWDDDDNFLGTRERRRRRHQAKKSIRNMRTRK